MNTKKKALISLALTLCIVLAMLLPVYAISPAKSLYIGGAEYDATTDQNGTGWNWDSDNLTLVLNGYVGDRIEYVSDSTTDTVKVLLVGENSITNTFSSGTVCTDINDAMSFEAALEIDGSSVSGSNGTLNITNDGSSADDCITNYYDGNLTTVSIKNATINLLEGDFGIYTKNLTLDNVKFNATEFYDALCADNNTINNSEIKIDDAKYAIDFVDITATNSSFKFNYSDYVENYESTVFDAWNDDSNSDEKYHTSDAIFTKCDIDIAFKIDDVTNDDTYLYAFDETDNLTFNETKVNFVNKDGGNSHAYTEFFCNCEKVNILNKSEVTFTDICDVFSCAEWQLVDSKLTGECGGCFTYVADKTTISNSELDVKCLDETTDDIWISNGLGADELNITNSTVRVKSTDETINTDALNITDSAVYFESVEDNIIYKLTDYTLTFTTPEYWQVLIDGVPSTTYTVESDDIVFGPKSFEIKYIHEHAYTVSYAPADGADAKGFHKAVCECGKVELQAHTWDAGVAAGTVKENGKEYKLTKYTCTKCGETKIVKTLINDLNVPNPKTGSTAEFSQYAFATLIVMAMGASITVLLLKKKEVTE